MSLDYLFFAPEKDDYLKLKKTDTNNARYSFIWKKNPKSLKDIFFKPFEASREFEYHLYRTFSAPIVFVCCWFMPWLLLSIAISAICTAIVLCLLCEQSAFESFHSFARTVGGLVLDLIMAPFSALILLTRSLSTIVSAISKWASPKENTTNNYVPPPTPFSAEIPPATPAASP